MIRNLKDLIFEWNAFNTLLILSTLSLFYLLFITNPSYTSVPSGVWHYIIARYSYGNSDFELDVWAKPVFTQYYWSLELKGESILISKAVTCAQEHILGNTWCELSVN